VLSCVRARLIGEGGGARECAALADAVGRTGRWLVSRALGLPAAAAATAAARLSTAPGDSESDATLNLLQLRDESGVARVLSSTTRVERSVTASTAAAFDCTRCHSALRSRDPDDDDAAVREARATGLCTECQDRVFTTRSVDAAAVAAVSAGYVQFRGLRATPFVEFASDTPLAFRVRGALWPSSEHYYLAHMCTDAGVREKVRVATAREAAVLAAAARQARRWRGDGARVDVMRDALRAKFGAHPRLGALLTRTGTATLAFEAPHDPYVCRANERGARVVCMRV
jgi:predicted NAD-dependent protein-ADP-ribosyltransferase YbiA (DUF1768 family)